MLPAERRQVLGVVLRDGPPHLPQRPGGVGYALGGESKRRDEAWELLKWLTGKEMQQLKVRLGEVFPPRRSLANSPDFLKPGEPPAHAALAVEAAERHVQVVPAFTRWQKMTALMNQDLGALWDGRDTAAAVAARIEPLVDTLLKESPTPS
ncbi:MAG: hypothetical protein M3442_10790 [Chloroflexota bacterium]|nr:hypothetical protein [Chloroflexota bacterium]